MNERTNTMGLCLDPKECAVRAVAGPQVLTLAILVSVALAAQCVVAALATAVSRDYMPLLGISLGVMVEALTCAGLWALALQSRTGQLGRSGFGLARVQPIVIGALMQALAAALLAMSVMLLFFQSELIVFLGNYFETMNWYLMSYLGIDFNVAPELMFAAASIGFAVLFAVAEMAALRYLLLARFVRKMRLMVTEGRTPRSYYGFPEVVSYLLGVGMALAGAATAASAAIADITDFGIGVVVALEGLCTFYTGIVIRAVGHETAAVHTVAARVRSEPQTPPPLGRDAGPIEGTANP